MKQLLTQDSELKTMEAGSRKRPASNHQPLTPEDIRIEHIPLIRIYRSETNPRTYFGEGKLAELAESIKQKGVVQPILVRPLNLAPIEGGEYNEESSKIQYFELIAGERRWRASKIAGKETIPAIVLSNVSDRDVLEIQVIENLQRSDLSPAEEAWGYDALIKDHGYTPDELAEKVGKSKSYIYGRLKLCNLPPAAMEALVKGDLPAATAELIGRLPSEKTREDFWADLFGQMGTVWFRMPSYRDVKESIERRYMRELKGAPFSQTDKKLVDGVGSCKDCPKRTGNNRGDYPDGRADICTDPGCFNLKVFAAKEKEAEKLEKSGAKVLRGEEAEKALGYGSGYIRLDDDCYEWVDKETERLDQVEDDGDEYTIEEKTYRDLVGDQIETIVAIGDDGRHIGLAKVDDVGKALKEGHGIEIARPKPRTNHDWKEQQKKAQKERQIRQQAAAEICERVTQSLTDNPITLTSRRTIGGFLEAVALRLVNEGDADVARLVAKRREIPTNSNDNRGSLAKAVSDLSDQTMMEFIIEYLMTDELQYWIQAGDHSWASKRGFNICQYFGFNPKLIEKRIAKETAETEKAEPKRTKAKKAA